VSAAIKHSEVAVNGAKLHVARFGSGRPILLLHGWPEFWFTWEPVMTRLADRFELIAPDLRGFGDSDKPVGRFGPVDQAADIAALIEQLGLRPVGVVAHDVGATVTQTLARLVPELIAGLFFFNFVYPGIGKRYANPAHLQETWHTFFNQSDLAPKLVAASPNAVRLFITHFLTRWAHREGTFDDATLDAFVRNFEKPGNLEGGFAHYRAVAQQRKDEYSGASTPPPIHLPTCVRWTDSDPTLDIAWADRLPEFFTDLDFQPFPGAGHFPHHENPDKAAAEIAGFFDRLPQSRWTGNQ
jgi:pimeloyl-ACP methyl ester carboxylesterase